MAGIFVDEGGEWVVAMLEGERYLLCGEAGQPLRPVHAGIRKSDPCVCHSALHSFLVSVAFLPDMNVSHTWISFSSEMFR